MTTFCKIFFYGILMLSGISSFCQVSISSNGSQPDPSAMLEIKSTNKGLLPPRVPLTAVNVSDPVVSPAVGLLVYNTATSGISPFNVVPGNYYWSGTQWIPVSPPQGSASGDMLYWNGTQYLLIPAGFPGQSLQMSASNIPGWVGAGFASVTTAVASSVTANTAISGGNIVSGGEGVITSRGICYDTLPNPTIGNDTKESGSGTGNFISGLTGLTVNKTYYVRAFAINSAGVGYGNEISFITSCGFNAPVSISVGPSSNPIPAGTFAAFNATPVNGGPNPFYQWKVNGTNVGSNSPTYSYGPVNGDKVKCILTSSLECTANNQATSNETTMVTMSGGGTVTLQNKTASPGQNVAVALSVTNFTSISAITLHIEFNPAVMSYSGFTLPSGSPGGMNVGVLNGNTLSIAGLWMSGVNFSGTMLTLNFTYAGMTSSPLNFLGDCEVVQGLSLIYPTYTNGSVSMATVPAEARIIPATAFTGGVVSVPIEYRNFAGSVSSITQKIHYDPSKLNFVSLTGFGNLASGTNYSANTGTGIITITWTSIGGKEINTLTTSSKFLLNFVYTGSIATNVDFVGGCLISSPAPVTNIPVTYFGGNISPAAPTATAVLGSVTGVLQDSDYEIPLILSGFPGGTIGGTQAFNLTILFDEPRLSFMGISSPAPVGLSVNHPSNGVVMLAWSNPAGPDINGTFLKLKFKYNGIGTADVAFGNGCVFNTYNAGVTGTVQVAYTDATLVPALATANTTIALLDGITNGANVMIPVNFAGLPPNAGAVDMAIHYDGSKLVYLGVQNNIFGAVVGQNAATHMINIDWIASPGVNINGKFIDLLFQYIGGGGGTTINFMDGCSVFSSSLIAIQTNWNSGGVNL